MKQFKKINLFFLFGLITLSVGAQTCSINQTDTVLCAGTTVNFTVTTTGGTPISWAWAFGDGFTADTATPDHSYIVSGTYTPTVTVTFSGGATCVVSGITVQVLAKPVARFSITSEDTMCYRGNQICINDQSSVGSSGAPIKKRVFQMSNGYININNSPPFSSTICYSDSVDEAGHLFSLVLEVTDENNCVDRLQKIDSIVVLPKIKPLVFELDTPSTCYVKHVTLTNTSAIAPAEVKSFIWYFGDGTTDETHWATVIHDYSGTGKFSPQLKIIDQFGCWDTSAPIAVFENIIPDTTIYGGPFNICYHDNLNGRYKSQNPEALSILELYDSDNILLDSRQDSLEFNFTTCGVYKLRMKLFFPKCFVQIDTPIQIFGPKTIIENRGVSGQRVINAYQCEVHDTVFFKTPNPYLTCMYKNGVKNHLWDFGDAFAPPCTTDTRNGINVGVNCNYSLDSMEVNHMYTPGKAKCYQTKLTITDPLRGCSHTDTKKLAFTSPEAAPDTLSVPPWRGLYISGSSNVACMGELIEYMFDEMAPGCGYEKLWINRDSACGADNFIMVDSINAEKYLTMYDTTCSEDGWITVGIVIQNGACLDTAWYHHFLRLFPIYPEGGMKVVSSCLPYTVFFQPLDSIQYNLARVRWNFNPLGTTVFDTVAQILGPNDSIIFAQHRVYETKGVHSVLSVYTDIMGCTRTDMLNFALGYKIQLLPSKTTGCVNDSILFSQGIRYYRYGEFDTLNHVDYWGDTTRALAGKEKLWWDFGDGQGFSETSPNTGHRYTKPGDYFIRLAAQDSTGCFDTLNYFFPISIVNPHANIAGLEATYYCAPQIVAYIDSTLYLDSMGNQTVVGVDPVVSWLWDFGDETPVSNLKDPAHNYRKNGIFRTLLTITTMAGCTDTASALIHMNGPQPSFVIRDTLGCEPFTATFINTTDTLLRSWTWYFGDAGNTTLTTLNRDTAKFTYTTPGIYSVKLLGVENVFNPNTGNTIICNAFFPDPLTDLPERKVYVVGIPPIDVIVKDTVCLNVPVEFKANGDSVYNGYKWTFGDGGSYTGTRPDTTAEHTYMASGVYAMQLIPVHSMGYECVDTVRKNIVAIPVEARFVIDSSKSPDYIFINQSPAGVRYEWDFGKPDAGAVNSSTSKDGLFKYQDTGTYTICLTVYNTENCWDTTCQQLRIIEAHVIIPNVFTPDNNDNKNDAFDIDIAGYKQYELKIYNRWGALVFEGNTDGIRNDGINWNGLVRNEGEECPAGTYYFIFTYQLITETKPTTITGTVTLIRDK